MTDATERYLRILHRSRIPVFSLADKHMDHSCPVWLENMVAKSVAPVTDPGHIMFSVHNMLLAELGSPDDIDVRNQVHAN